MAKPNNAIATIKIPGDTDARPIVPYYVGVNSSNNYVVTLPQLTEDAHFIIDKQDQSIDGFKTFTAATYFESNAWISGTLGIWDNTDGDYVNFQCSNGGFQFYSNYYGSKWHFGYNNTTPWISYEDGNDNQYTYSFPTQSGTLGLQIDIVDLTSL